MEADRVSGLVAHRELQAEDAVWGKGVGMGRWGIPSGVTVQGDICFAVAGRAGKHCVVRNAQNAWITDRRHESDSAQGVGMDGRTYIVSGIPIEREEARSGHRAP